MRRSATLLPKPDSGPIFKNRGIPTFPLGDCPHERVIPTNSHTSRGRLAPDKPIRVKLPSAGQQRCCKKLELRKRSQMSRRWIRRGGSPDNHVPQADCVTE